MEQWWPQARAVLSRGGPGGLLLQPDCIGHWRWVSATLSLYPWKGEVHPSPLQSLLNPCSDSGPPSFLRGRS